MPNQLFPNKILIRKDMLLRKGKNLSQLTVSQQGQSSTNLLGLPPYNFTFQGKNLLLGAG